MERQSQPGSCIRFGPFELDLRTAELEFNGRRTLLNEQPFRVLVALLERPGELISREELVQRLWSDGTFVDYERGLNKAVNRLRDVLRDSADSPRFIETIPRRGYRFIAPVEGKVHIGVDSQELGSDPESNRAPTGAGESLAFDSQTAGLSSPVPVSLRPARRRRRLFSFLLVPALVSAAVVATYVLQRNNAKSSPAPAFHRLTFQREYVSEARFAPGEQSVIYSAMRGGGPGEMFSTSIPSPESRPLGLHDLVLDAVSTSGEIAFRTSPRGIDASPLFRVPESGGAPRLVIENAMWADWSPDGKSLAVVTEVRGQNRVEYPIGKVLFETAGWISDLRFSPQGDRLAFLVHVTNNSFAGSVEMVDLKGAHRTLSSDWKSMYGLAWSPKGDEVWFTASKAGHAYALSAVTLSGKERVITRSAGALTLHDIASDGRVLLTRDNYSFGIMACTGGESKERELSWLDASVLVDISRDGKQILFGEGGEGGGEAHSVYLRSIDGASEPVRLGEGDPLALSPDGRWALAYPAGSPDRFVLLPVGAGASRVITLSPIELQGWPVWWTPDSKKIYFQGSEPGHGVRIYGLEPDNGHPKPVLPEGVLGVMLSPDGKSLIGFDKDNRGALFSLPDGTARIVPGLVARDTLASWSADGKFLYVLKEALPGEVYRVDLTTGSRTLWKTFMPADPTGVVDIGPVLVTPDGKSYAYSYDRINSDLYVVSGLK